MNWPLVSLGLTLKVLKKDLLAEITFRSVSSTIKGSRIFSMMLSAYVRASSIFCCAFLRSVISIKIATTPSILLSIVWYGLIYTEYQFPPPLFISNVFGLSDFITSESIFSKSGISTLSLILLIGLPISEGITLSTLSAWGVILRITRSIPIIIIGILVLPSKFIKSSFSRTTSLLRLCSSSLVVINSSFEDCSSSLAVSSSSLVLCSSSLLESISSLAVFTSSFALSCSSITDWRYSLVSKSSFCMDSTYFSFLTDFPRAFGKFLDPTALVISSKSTRKNSSLRGPDFTGMTVILTLILRSLYFTSWASLFTVCFVSLALYIAARKGRNNPSVANLNILRLGLPAAD